MADEINFLGTEQVQVIFEIPYGDLVYRDALYFTSSEYSGLSQNDIDTLKTDRYNNWVSNITPR